MSSRDSLRIYYNKGFKMSLCEGIIKSIFLFHLISISLLTSIKVNSMAKKNLEGNQPLDLEKHPSSIIPTIQNIVSTIRLDYRLVLKAISLQARNAEYNAKHFAAFIMRIRDPKTTAWIFALGNMARMR